MCSGGSPIDDLWDSVTEPAKDLAGGAINIAGDVLQTVGDVAENVIKNPLPVIQTVALTAALGPSGLAIASTATSAAIAGAAISAMNGGKIEDIALAAGTAYLGTQIGGAAGKEIVATEAVKAMDEATRITIQRVVTGASTSAATVALRGGSLEDVLKAGTTSAVGSYVRSTLTMPPQLGGYGFDPKALDTNLITTATAAATRAVLNGKSIADAVAMSSTVAAISMTLSGNVDKLRSSDAAYQRVYNDFSSLKDRASNLFAREIAPAQDIVQKDYDEAKNLSSEYDSKYAQYQSLVNDNNAYKNAYNNYNNLSPTTINGVQYSSIYANWPSQEITTVRFDVDRRTGIQTPVPVSRDFFLNEANRAATEANNLATNTLNPLATKVEDAYRRYMKSYETLGDVDYVENVKEYEAYVKRLNELNFEASRLAAEQARLAEETAKLVVDYEFEAAKAERDLGEKIKTQSLKEAEKIVYITNATKQAEAMGFSPEEAKAIAQGFYDSTQAKGGVQVAEAVEVTRRLIRTDVDPTGDRWYTYGLETKDGNLIPGYVIGSQKADLDGTKTTLNISQEPSAGDGTKASELTPGFKIQTGDPNELLDTILREQDYFVGRDEIYKEEQAGLDRQAEEERQRLVAEEAERQRLAAEESERQRLAAEEAERQRQAEEAERLRIEAERAATEAERLRLEAEEAERQRVLAILLEEEKERQRIAAEEAERARIAAEEAAREAERQRLAAEEAERERQRIEEAERIRLAEEEAERQRIAEAERQRLAAEEAERARLAAEEAERQRQIDEAERARLAAEEAAREAERLRLISEQAERDRLAAEEQERARLAAEQAAAEAERLRLESEEMARIEAERVAAIEEARRAEEAERQRLEAEEAERLRLAAEEAERVRLAEEERLRLEAEEVARIEAERVAAIEEARRAEEAEQARLAAEQAERDRLAAEQAERDRLAAEQGTGGQGTGGQGIGGEGTEPGGTGTGGDGTGDSGDGGGGILPPPDEEEPEPEEEEEQPPSGGGGTTIPGGITGGGTTGGGTTGGGTTGGGTTGGGTSGGLGGLRINPAFIAAMTSLLAPRGGSGSGGINVGQVALPQLIASRQAIPRSETGEFITPVQYTYASTGTPYEPGQPAPSAPAAPITAAQGGLMIDSLIDPTNAVRMYASGGGVDSGQIYKLAQASGLGTDTDTLNSLMRYISQGMSPQDAVDYYHRRTSKSKTPRGKGDMEGLMGLAKGGNLPPRYLNGSTDGMADKVPAKIGDKQPAALSHGEFVIPADVVSHLGNGNSEAGAKVLYDMMAKIRKARTGTPKQGKQINPSKFLPKG